MTSAAGDDNNTMFHGIRAVIGYNGTTGNVVIGKLN